MEISLERNNISYSKKVFGSVLSQEETTEMIVPDSMPDILRIVDVDGVVFIRSKDAEGGRVTASGSVSATVIYAPDGAEGIRRLTCDIPYKFSASGEEINTQTNVVARITLASADASIVNSRKLVVRAALSAEISCYNDTGATVCSSSSCDESAGLLLLPTINTASVYCAVREKTFVLSDELTLSGSNPPVAELLKARSELVIEDSKAVGSKLVVRGIARTLIVYRAAGGNGVFSESFDNEFSQIVELDTEVENGEFEAIPMLTSEYYDADMMTSEQNGRTIITELHAVLQCTAARQISIASIQDAYSTRYRLSEQRETLTFHDVRRNAPVGGVFKAVIEASPRPERVITVDTYSGGVTTKAENGVLELSSAVFARVVYSSDDGNVYSVIHRLEASASCHAEQNAAYDAELRFGKDVYAMASAGVVELRIPAEFHITEVHKLELSAIAALEADENEPLELSAAPSIIVRRAEDGDTLWSLAKRYNSTPAAILEINGLEPGEPIKSRQLLIMPKKR